MERDLYPCPQDWDTATLSEACRLITDGSHFSPVPQSEGHPIVNVKDFRDGFVDVDSCTKISDVAFSALEAGNCTVSPGDVLLSKDGTIGKVVVYKQEGVLAALSSVCIMRPNRLIHAGYLGQALTSENLVRQMANMMSGSALRRLVLRDIKSLEIQFPSPPEQRRMAEILDTVDEAIRRTEQLVTKLQQMKQGLLHDLLTRGIDKNGELRPPPEEAPHLYKDSPLGLIPKGWETSRLSSRFEVKGGKRLPFGHQYSATPTGYRYLRVLDFYEKPVCFEALENLCPNTFLALQRYEIVEPDIYISIAGSIGHAGVFRPKPMSPDRTILTENAARLTAKSEVSPEFVVLQMNHARIQRQVDVEKGTGGGVPKLALFRIESLLLAWPRVCEQKRIANRATRLGEYVATETESLNKLRTLKKGLMDDLLTGTVRVPETILEGAKSV